MGIESLFDIGGIGLPAGEPKDILESLALYILIEEFCFATAHGRLETNDFKLFANGLERCLSIK